MFSSHISLHHIIENRIIFHGDPTTQPRNLGARHQPPENWRLYFVSLLLDLRWCIISLLTFVDLFGPLGLLTFGFCVPLNPRCSESLSPVCYYVFVGSSDLFARRRLISLAFVETFILVILLSSDPRPDPCTPVPRLFYTRTPSNLNFSVDWHVAF